jgi:hypothetical protein
MDIVSTIFVVPIHPACIPEGLSTEERVEAYRKWYDIIDLNDIPEDEGDW